jgi:hypothetical protein
VVVRKTTKPKVKPIKTIEIELAIAKAYGIRQYVIVPNISWGFKWMHECDLYLFSKSGIATEIEIKISKADLLKDFKKGHHHKDGAGRITYFYYAMPEDLYEKCKDLIPEEAGVYVCNRGSWEGAGVYAKEKRKPTKIKNSRKLSTEEQLKVASLGCMRIWSLKSKIIGLQNTIQDGKTK